MASFELPAYLAQLREPIDRALADALPPAGKRDPLQLREAMSCALLEGGKRLRPCLTLAACQAVGGPLEQALPAACAVELVHAYSLVHDDLPAMDNDDLRRGQPTCHKRFGEAAAILAGDGLLALAFQVLAEVPAAASQPEASGSQPAGPEIPNRTLQQLQAVHELARAAGPRGLVGGQALDLELKGQQPAFEMVELCHAGKTAALFSAAAAMGGIVGGGDPVQVENLRSYGFDFGLAFQHADDLEDGGSLPPGRASERATGLTRRAAATARRLGQQSEALVALAEWLEGRIRSSQATPTGS